MSNKEFFTPKQVYLGSFLGGPFAAAYYVSENFRSMGKAELAKLSIVISVVVSIALFVLVYQLPENFPYTIIPIAYSGLAASVTWKLQVTKEEIDAVESYSFRSNWKVFFSSLAALAFTYVSLFIFFFVFQ
ncbi:MAG: hypothetical protein KKF22_11475 [Gammaproteobacteria bacterium]|nr:hypothetical protein [Gammaproteobacteria bacterium]